MVKKFLVSILVVLLSFFAVGLGGACKGVENPSNTGVETPEGDNTGDGNPDGGETTPDGDEDTPDGGTTTPEDGNTEGEETKPDKENKPGDGNSFVEGDGPNDLPIVPFT